MKCLVFTLLLGFFTVETLAVWHRSYFPNPQKPPNDPNKDECNRQGKKSWICDPNQVLSFDEANQLDSGMSKLANVTLCPCSDHVCKQDRRGYQVAIAIAPKILSDEEMALYAEDMPDYNKDYEPIVRLHHTQVFAHTLFKQWKLDRRCEDGILIVYDPENFALYTVGGKVAMKRLTPSKMGDITGINKDEFGNGGTFAGLQKMLADYRDVLLNRYNMPIYGHRPKTAAVISDRNSATQPITSIVSLLLLPILAAIL